MLNHLKKFKVILASGSPRRQHFLKEMGIDFEIRLKEIEEIFPENLKAVEITDYLAKLKAAAFTNLSENEILITSDTIVWHDGKAVGKPKNYEDAFAILKSFSNATHEVFTSVCFSGKDFCEVIHEKTRVTFTELLDHEIHYYLEHYKPYDKAGAYGIQEWIGLIGISKIEGSYTNVVGLPVEKVYHFLANFKK
ncbi:septum formation protein Maf [Flavobacterium sp. NST-5]|uniref:dTTP/UTP pyrophosphatase n=1 Tax=Flavobacterium ichthyis TaxID=2698827 RepID=A0ABW9Z650_9FLAO|nr:Maf family nucleotide pyrophosphatase [Flavobacterium ichthyis]NBL64322.1 septum formation protein Maf [Flavobacterium ichthyis]